MKRTLTILLIVAILLLAMEVKVRFGNNAQALETVGYPTGIMVKSLNGVVWEITVDNNGVLGTDSVGVWQ